MSKLEVLHGRACERLESLCKNPMAKMGTGAAVAALVADVLAVQAALIIEVELIKRGQNGAE